MSFVRLALCVSGVYSMFLVSIEAFYHDSILIIG